MMEESYEDKLAREAAEWIESEEGQRCLREARTRGAQTVEYLRKAREIDPAKMEEPVTL
jgi:hypothetical protein